MRNLTGTTAFVTGAASGIGLGIAAALVRAGVKVMLCDIDEPALASAVAGLRQVGGDVDSVRADVSLRADVQQAAEATLERYGDVHVLVNNAGVVGGGPYGAWTEAGWRWPIEVNLLGMVWGVDIFAPLLERHGEGGHIVSTASVAGVVPGLTIPYSVTKSAIVSLSEGLRRDLAGRGIGVSVLCPGTVNTSLADSSRTLPQRFQDGSPSTAPPEANPAQLEGFRALIAGGIDAGHVGELVREGIEGNWDYIFTEIAAESEVTARYEAIKRGFDRIRERPR